MTLDTTVRTSGMDCAGHSGAVEAVGSEGEADLTAKTERRCEVDGCDQPLHARKKCRHHYMKAWYRGELPLIQHRVIPWGGSYRDEMDEAVVERLVAGDAVPFMRWERIEAVKILRRRGLSYRGIAMHLRIPERQVHRDLTVLGRVGAK